MGNGTSIGRVRGLGSAKSGTHHWLLQRWTAIGNLVLVAYLAVSLLLLIAVIGALVLARPHEKVGPVSDAANSPAGQAKPDNGGAH